MMLETTKDIAVIVGTCIALITFIKVVIEYTQQNTQKRADHYCELRNKFRDDEQFRSMFELLEYDNENLANIPFQQKQHLIGFYEDIALYVNAGLIKKEVAHYMFAYYALRCWDSKYFWNDLSRESPYWSLFRNFVDQMKEVEKDLIDRKINPAKFKL